MPGGGVGEALLISGGASLLGGVASGLIQNEASKDAARAQTKAVKQGMEAQEQAFAQAQQLQQPFLQQGQGAFSQLAEGILGGQFNRTPGEFQSRQFSQADILADPGIQFAQEQAQKSLETSAAARGGLLGGRAVKEGQRTAANLAGQQAQQAFGRQFAQEQARFGQFQDLQNRLSAEDASRFSRLAGLADVGRSTAAGLGNLSIGQGANQASSFSQLGNIEAARQMAEGQAFQQPVNALTEFAQLAPFLLGGGAPGAGAGSLSGGPTSQQLFNVGSMS